MAAPQWRNRMKYRKLLILTIMAGCFLMGTVGCSKKSLSLNNTETTQNITDTATVAQADTSAEVSTSTDVVFPETYNEEINGVSFQTTVELPENFDQSKLYVSTAKRQTPDIEKAKETLAADKTTESEESGTGEGDSGSFSTYYGKYTDGSSLSVGAETVFSTSLFSDISNAFDTYSADDGTSAYAENGSLSFGTGGDCFTKVLDIINHLGYSAGDCDYISYALDAETMSQQETILSKSGEIVESGGRDWSSEDDSYYFFIEQLYEGLPVYYGEQDFPEDSPSNRPVLAVYNADGPVYLYIMKLYSFTETQEKVKLLEFGDIAEKVAGKYGEILTSASYNVTRAKLYQMPVKDASGNYDVKPVWLFEVHESGTDSETGEVFENTLYTLIDASTGEEVSV